MPKPPNTDGVRAALADAKPVRPRSPPPKRGGDDKRAPEQWSGIGLPDGCPVRAVGIQKTSCIFLDSLGQLIEAGPRDLGQAHLSIYFAGDIDYLAAWWPYFDKDGIWKEFKFTPERCQRSIQLACAEAGVWANFEKVRGRGAWRGPATPANKNGELVLHCGDVIIAGDDQKLPDIHDGFVYPAGEPILQPLPRSAKLKPAHDRDSVGPVLLRMFKTWNWRRPVLDPRLFLGALVASMLGGALHWRPSAWITGESGSGKTTLMELRRQVAAGWSFNAEDASESGISTLLGYDAIGVSLDEQENSQDNRKLNAIVELMRRAASGSLKVRGSASHSGHAFRSRNSFIASSINAAPLKAQDMNRMARLELDVLPDNAARPQWTRAQAMEWGAEILRRCIDQWPRFDDTLAAYQHDLHSVGHDQRGQDTFGVLMACADLVLSDTCMLESGGDPDRNVLWNLLTVANMPEYADRLASWQACLLHLLSSRPRDWKSPGPASIGDVCRMFLRWKYATDKEGKSLDDANDMLAMAGLTITVVREPGHPFVGQFCLGVPNTHPALNPLFDQTDWRGEASTVGGWIAALGRGDPAKIQRGVRFRIAGSQHRGVVVRLDQVIEWADELDLKATK